MLRTRIYDATMGLCNSSVSWKSSGRKDALLRAVPPRYAMKWSKEDTVKLIELFRRRSELWNPNDTDYRNRRRKHDAWRSIAKDFNINKEEVEKKMRMLVGQFQREWKKRTNLPVSSANNESKWFGFRLLLFLKDKHTLRLTHEPGSVQRNSPPERNFVKTCGNFTINELNDKESSGTRDSTKFKASCQNQSLETMRLDSKSNHEVPAEGRAITKNVPTEIRRDEYDIFGEHVAHKIRKLRTEYAKSTAQYHINNILYQAEIGQYVQPYQEFYGQDAQDTSGTSTPASTVSGISTFKTEVSMKTSSAVDSHEENTY